MHPVGMKLLPDRAPRRIPDPNNPHRLSWAVSARPSTITIPEHAHPLAKLVFAEMKRQRVSYSELEHRSSVLISTFKAWRTDNTPGLSSISAALGALGWELVPVPKLEQIPEDVRPKVEALAQDLASRREALGAAIAAAAAFPAYGARGQAIPARKPVAGVLEFEGARK